ncbi:MAG: hypothetical protein B6243_13515 [Anaerolineaceae bacterium 4572_5.2]|nr:MAG: hypothetical protein B6243_13515 [Anaerolineaceae bacterium 4572_5.2]
MNKPFNYGGQAVIEGVMMRGQKRMTVAVRRPDGGIELHSEALNPRIYNSTINKIPFARGITMLWDALGLGMRALMYSADVAMGEEDVKFEGPMAWGTVAFSLVLAVALFFVMPLLLIGWAENYLGAGLWSNIAEGVLRLSIFLLYIWGIGFMPDIRRVFGYHGAEHKAINAYERDVELIPEEMAKQNITHPRCGTAFLLIVMVISIFVFVLLGTPSIWLRIISRILLIPVIAGIAYEFLKFSAAHEENPVMKILIAPGLALQRLTTREPDLSMLEVSAAALTQLLQEENILPQPVATPISIDPLAAPVES